METIPYGSQIRFSLQQNQICITARSLGGDLKLEFGTLGGASFLLTIPKS